MNPVSARRLVSVALAATLSVLASSASPLHAQTTGSAAPASDSANKNALVINRIVAVVNNEPVMLSEIMDRVIRMRQNIKTDMDSAALAELQRAAVQDAIDELLLQQKAKVEKVEVSDTDVQQAANEDYREVRARFPSDAEFAQALRESGFGTIEEFRKSREEQTRDAMVRQNLLAKLHQSGRIPAVNVTEAEVTAEYERSKDVLPKRQASASFRQIIFPVVPSAESKRRAKAKIDSLATELEARPTDFESVAKRESMDGSRDLGGDLGWTRRGQTVPEFERVIFALNPGIISPVVETVYGYHLIRVDRVQSAEVKARHILIKFPIDSADETRAFQLADSVATAWRAGASYDSLTSEFHDEKNNEERSIPDLEIATMPVSYQTAIKDHKVGDIVGPFTIRDERNSVDKPVVLQITDLKEAGDYTIAELRQRLRANLTEIKSMRRFLDSLKREAYVWTLEPTQAAPGDKKNP